MEFSQSADHEAIREGVRRVCAEFPDEYWAAKDEAHEFPWEFYDALAEGGWVGIAIPEEYGGGGQGITEASVMLEEIAASGAAMNGCSARPPVDLRDGARASHGSPELAADVLPRVASGELHVAFGVTEPDAGTDTTSIRTRAVPRRRRVRGARAQGVDHEGAVLRDVPAARAHHAARGVREAHRRHDAAAGRPAAARGRHPPDPEARPQRGGVVRGALRRPARAGRAAASARRARASRYLLDGLNPERILIAAEALGIGRAAHAPRGRLRQRARRVRPADRPEPGHRVPARRGAHARCTPPSSPSARRRGGSTTGLPCGEAANTAKYLAAEAAFFAADRAMQTLGGMGYASEYHVERYWREARLMRIAPVSQEMVLQLHRRARARPPQVVLTPLP